MPQNIVDADLWTVTVQVAADGDAVDGASQVLIGQDLTDRTRWLYNRHIQTTSPVHNGAGTPATTAFVEAVGAGAASATVRSNVDIIPADLTVGDTLLMQSSVRAQPTGAGAGLAWRFWHYDALQAAPVGINGIIEYDNYTTVAAEYFTILLSQYIYVDATIAGQGLDLRIWNGSAQSVDLWSPWVIRAHLFARGV